ncbi:MAG: YbdK family carboxylate-amine ligase [Solirubrobacterales bacterium]|nr:YbdK family carboxylate-amine ligase [Solirubrobacterales bacterium]
MAAAAPDPIAFPASVAPNAEQLRAAFAKSPANSVGLEDEVMLLDPDSLELLPRAHQVLASLGDSETFKLELPASQLEIVTTPNASVPELGATLLATRRELLSHLGGSALAASAGVHPFSTGVGELNQLERYSQTIVEHGRLAQRQLVCALQVHISVGDADRALAVYNAARSYLPLIAALAANAPFYEGRDTGLASVRPKLSELLPRQGVPPAIDSWESHAKALAWGAASGAFPPRTWWWELRPHVGYGTLEFRVPDGQSSVADATAIAAFVQALAAWLGERYDAGAREPVAETWRIAENRWLACRYGVEGTLPDLQTGERLPTRERLLELIETLQPTATRLGSAALIDHARQLTAVNGALAQRQVAAQLGVRGVAAWLAGRFLDAPSG